MFAGSRLLLPVYTNCVTLVPKPGRKEGHAVREPSLLSGIFTLKDRWAIKSAEKIGQQEVAETASGCPKRWCWSKRRTGGTEDSLPCSWVEEGWLPSERERRSRPVRLEAEACCHPPCLGRSRERGTRCRLPSTGGATAVRQEADEHRAVHQRGPVPSHGTASEPLSWLRTERQCVREPDRDFFFLLSPLSRLCHSSSFRLLSLASSVLTPRYAAAALTGSPRERGEGGSRAQSREYPPACEGRWGYVTSGAGPRAVGTERGRWSEWSKDRKQTK